MSMPGDGGEDACPFREGPSMREEKGGGRTIGTFEGSSTKE